MTVSRFKFRIFYKPNYKKPEMIYNAERTYDNGCSGVGSIYHESFGEILNDKDCIVMQSTGTADKNGKEIYEGDIVKIDNLIKQVKFTCYGCRFQLTDKDGYFFDSIYKNRTDEIEVIGNIFENKDLLKN